LVEAPTGVGKTRIALEFVRKFWRRRGRCRVLVVVPRRVLAYNPWKKEIDRWMSDLEPKCLILSGFMPPRERVLALSSFQGDFLLMTAIALNNDYILGSIKLDSFDMVIPGDAHRMRPSQRSRAVQVLGSLQAARYFPTGAVIELPS